MNGTLLAIWSKRAKRGPMDPRSTARLVAGRGLEGSANQGGRRQVTLLAEEAWQAALAELGVDLDPRLRRANLYLRGLDLAGSRNRILRIGPEVRLRLLGEVRPCERMDEAHLGLRRALDPDWRGGVFAEVLTGGEIAVGDVLVWGEPEA